MVRKDKINVQKKTFGQRVRSLRRAKKFSQPKLALLTGVSRSAVSKWETDAVNPRWKHCKLLAAIFDTTPDFLMSGEADSLTDNELAIMLLYRSSGIEEQKILLELAKRLGRGQS